MSFTISDTFVTSTGPTNGATVYAYKASRFSSVPTLNTPAPGGPDSSSVITGLPFGGPGQFQIEVNTNEPYYLSFDYHSQLTWKLYTAANFTNGTQGSIVFNGNIDGGINRGVNFAQGQAPTDLATVSQIVPGPQGAQGPQGTPSTVQGPQGAQGPQGVQGAGFQGSQGAQGVQGAQGPQGTQGNNGNIGPAGLQGAQGSQGATGQIGFQGSTGAQGTQGVQGSQGNQGNQGVQGAGFQGATGAQGPQGTQGNQGFQGPTDVVTSATAPGNQSVLWLDTSATGNGTQGPQGAQGAASTVAGPQGSTGAQGAQGLTGPQGSTGSQGATGAQGSQGPQGFQGNQGSQGSQGADGAQGATGSQGSQGATGSQGSAGAQGATGAQGAQGSQGAQGNTAFGTYWTPNAQNGFLAWSYDPTAAASVGAPTKGQVFYTGFISPVDITVNSILFFVTNAGTSVSTSYAGIYSQSGALLQGSSDFSTALMASGTATASLTASYTMTANTVYYVAFLIGNGTTTSPSFLAAGSSTGSGNAFNAGTSFTANTLAGGARVATVAGTTLTALPSNVSGTPSSGATVPRIVWFGLK